jgi:Domain of unknown function (DUF4282)
MNTRPDTNQELGMKTLLFLDTMLTPKIITFLYWIIGALSLLGGLGVMLGGLGSLFSGRIGAGIGALILGPIVAVLGLVYARILCEFMVVIFKIYDNTTQIANRKESD